MSHLPRNASLAVLAPMPSSRTRLRSAVLADPPSQRSRSHIPCRRPRRRRRPHTHPSTVHALDRRTSGPPNNRDSIRPPRNNRDPSTPAVDNTGPGPSTAGLSRRSRSHSPCRRPHRPWAVESSSLAQLLRRRRRGISRTRLYARVQRGISQRPRSCAVNNQDLTATAFVRMCPRRLLRAVVTAPTRPLVVDGVQTRLL